MHYLEIYKNTIKITNDAMPRLSETVISHIQDGNTSEHYLLEPPDEVEFASQGYHEDLYRELSSSLVVNQNIRELTLQPTVHSINNTCIAMEAGMVAAIMTGLTGEQCHVKKLVFNSLSAESLGGQS